MTKSTTDRILQKYRESGLTYDEIAKLAGVSSSTLQRYATGQIKRVDLDFLAKIAPALNTNASYLAGWTDDSPLIPSNVFLVKKKSFPMLGKIACGEPIFAEEERGVSIDASADIKADFCLRCAGESMIGDGINDGDIVFIKNQPIVNNGEIACIIVDDEATLKHFYSDGKQVTLVGSNSKFMPLVFNESDCKNIKILGKAVALTRIL